MQLIADWFLQPNMLRCWIAGLQERTQAAASAVRVLDDKVSRQLSNIRNDTKQAITVATAVASKSWKAEVQSDIDSKARETERRLRLELEGAVAAALVISC